ncbi:unnamed protein product [marine sediment metagenome]|uniref:Uncharacterized protein n=1 Tax=marine sediment metagenome TaxID=412755 RepID=X1GCX1_9ZZZZ
MNTSSYLELHWLAKADKYILLPPVIFADIPYGGYFRLPEKKEVVIDDKFYPADRGLIVISENYSSHVESSIAHEWRHLWQYYKRGKPKWIATWNLKSPFSYKNQIVIFFMSDPSEYDALLFQLKKAPDDVARQWYEWIIKQ